MEKFFPKLSALTTAMPVLSLALIALFLTAGECAMPENQKPETISLPQPDITGTRTLEQVLAGRRSQRNFSKTALDLKEISQLFWAAQGITGSSVFRTAPSAGALYPLEIYVISGPGNELAAGVYHYHSKDHLLQKTASGDLRKELCEAALSQAAVENAPATFLITGIFERTTKKYGQRGLTYVFMEAGHAAQNLLLQAGALGLGAVPIGAFSNKKVSELIKLPQDEQPLYLIPTGHPEDQ